MREVPSTEAKSTDSRWTNDGLLQAGLIISRLAEANASFRGLPLKAICRSCSNQQRSNFRLVRARNVHKKLPFNAIIERETPLLTVNSVPATSPSLRQLMSSDILTATPQPMKSISNNSFDVVCPDVDGDDTSRTQQSS